jgi:hypothetical protein
MGGYEYSESCERRKEGRNGMEWLSRAAAAAVESRLVASPQLCIFPSHPICVQRHYRYRIPLGNSEYVL